MLKQPASALVRDFCYISHFLFRYVSSWYRCTILPIALILYPTLSSLYSYYTYTLDYLHLHDANL